MYFSHEYLWKKDADQSVEKYVHMSTVIGASRLGTQFSQITRYMAAVLLPLWHAAHLCARYLSLSLACECECTYVESYYLPWLGLGSHLFQ